MINWRKQVHRLQVDITSYCNARCGACSRNLYGGDTIPHLPISHFNVDLWNRLVTEDTAGWDLTCLSLNGNWGDPGMHPRLPQMMETFSKAHPNAVIFMSTNGGTHNPTYWAELGEALSKNSYFHRVDFGVDGLADTNHLYRRGTVFERIMENMKAFNEAGGNSRWIFNVFDHNKHQIEEAVKLAEEYGCLEFSSRRSNATSCLIDTPDEKYVLTTNDLSDVEYKTWQFKDDSLLIEVHEKMTALKADSPCPWYNNGNVQIDPWGFVWPCCHISEYTYTDDLKGVVVDDMFTDHGQFNNLKNNTFADILEHTWYTEEQPDAVNTGKWEICREECGACGAV